MVGKRPAHWIPEREAKKWLMHMIEEEVARLAGDNIDFEKLLANINSRLQNFLNKQEMILFYRP